MSKLRSINTIIWSDPWFELLEPSAKLLFIYLVTNEKTNMLGVYEISIRKVSFETGIKQSEIERYLKEFELSKKIKYAENRVLLLNFLKHQNYNFNMMKSAIRTYNKLPLSLRNSELIIPETKEGFETLCKGFAGVRKIEIEDESEIEDEIELKENARALDFLNLNAQSRFEAFTMQNKANVNDWQMMLDSYNDQIDLEIAQNKISFNVDELFPRLSKWCRAWISNQKPDQGVPVNFGNGKVIGKSNQIRK